MTNVVYVYVRYQECPNGGGAVTCDNNRSITMKLA